MKFNMFPEHEMIHKIVSQFAMKEVAPSASERDQKEEFSRDIFDKMAAAGLTGIPWEEEYGGAGAGCLAYMIALEELSRVCASTSMTLFTHISLCSRSIRKYGNEEQKKKYLNPLAEGSALGGYGLTEEHAGSDATNLQATARLEGDYYFLNGSNTLTVNGEGDIFVVFASTDKSRGVNGISAFIIEKEYPGVRIGEKEKKLGTRSACTCELIFENCRVPEKNLLGEEGKGIIIATDTLEGGYCGMAAQAVGIAWGAFEYALDYAKNREQFDQSIFSFQGVSFMLAEMATKIEASRLMTYQAAWLEDVGLPSGNAAAMAKLFASDTAMEVTTNAVQIFGGYGYSREYPLERMMRDAKFTQIYEGYKDIQRSDILLPTNHDERMSCCA